MILYEYGPEVRGLSLQLCQDAYVCRICATCILVYTCVYNLLGDAHVWECMPGYLSAYTCVCDLQPEKINYILCLQTHSLMPWPPWSSCFQLGPHGRLGVFLTLFKFYFVDYNIFIPFSIHFLPSNGPKTLHVLFQNHFFYPHKWDNATLCKFNPSLQW